MDYIDLISAVDFHVNIINTALLKVWGPAPGGPEWHQFQQWSQPSFILFLIKNNGLKFIKLILNLKL